MGRSTRKESPPTWLQCSWGFSIEQDFACKSDNFVQCVCWHIVVQNNSVTPYFHEIPNTRSEQVRRKCNRGLSDNCACAAPFLLRHRVLSNRSSAVSMTNLADLEVRRNKLVSCCGKSLFPPIQQYLFQREKVWIDCDSVTLQCTNAVNRSLLVLTILHSGFVGGTTEYVNPSFFQFLSVLCIFQGCCNG